MNVLIAGYGGIGKAIHALIKAQPLEWINEIYIAEIATGISAQEMIRQKKDVLDLVINVTTDYGDTILKLCRDHKIHYLDTGLENAGDIIDLLAAPAPSETVNLFGFGMNPGLIEFMYRRQDVSGKHSVIEIEHDTAEFPDAVFGTWSPQMYYSEAVEEPPFAYVNGEMLEIFRSDQGPDMELEIEGHQPRKYLWIPHEEIYSMGSSNDECQFAGYLYSAPEMIQSLAIECRKSGGKFPDLPVRHRLKGSDTIGLLLLDESGGATYVYNRASHQQCYDSFQVNATCWQVACGIYSGLSVLDKLAPGNYTMSTIPQSLLGCIDTQLKMLGFDISIQQLKRPDKLRNVKVKLADGEKMAWCGF
ncbi:hypothetical protein C4J81_11745 [Deltaproteobacteria bacterium Smac51]|nr:hypothetical protein C4J81_11745 [Deltaproteobacteria bacterium Smac51]